jgi:hypothetical protein
MTLPAVDDNVTWTWSVAVPQPLPCCRTCLFWSTDEQGLVGECQSMYFNDMVWSEFGGFLLTQPKFKCDFYEAKDGDK